jgi:hypothetical protein
MIAFSLRAKPLLRKQPQKKRVLEEFMQVYFTTIDLNIKSCNNINKLLIHKKQFMKKYKKWHIKSNVQKLQ